MTDSVDTAALRVLADNINVAPAIWGHDAVRPLRAAADEIDALRARAERAESVVAAAPHADDCIGWFQTLTVGVHDGTCTCWKADYARASQPASEVEQ